jgi:hypothetical protein
VTPQREVIATPNTVLTTPYRTRDGQVRGFFPPFPPKFTYVKSCISDNHSFFIYLFIFTALGIEFFTIFFC